MIPGGWMDGWTWTRCGVRPISLTLNATLEHRIWYSLDKNSANIIIIKRPPWINNKNKTLVASCFIVNGKEPNIINNVKQTEINDLLEQKLMSSRKEMLQWNGVLSHHL